MANDVTILDANNDPQIIRTVELSGKHYPINIKHSLPRQEIFTAPASGTTQDASTIPVSKFSLQVKGTGATPGAWEVVLEVSLDNANFTPFLTHKSGVQADGAIVWAQSEAPVSYWRLRCVGLTLGGASNVVANGLAEAA